MEVIKLEKFGKITQYDAAYVISGTDVVAAFGEPEARSDEGFDEEAFRAAVEAEVGTWEALDYYPLTIQFDPGRDEVSEVELPARA